MFFLMRSSSLGVIRNKIYRMKKSVIILIALGLLGVWCFGWLFITYPLHVNKSVPSGVLNEIPEIKRNLEVPPRAEIRVSVMRSSAEKTILFYDFPSYYELAGLTSNSCRKKCKFSINSSLVQSADAVVFFSHDHILGRTSIDVTKSIGQTWVFFAVESPPYAHVGSLAHQKFRQTFNWTMTYRHDSDIFFGYLQTDKRSVPVPDAERKTELQLLKDAFSKKTKMVAWFVSHCDTSSMREKYVQELKKHIQVDIYGACGNLKCGNWSECDKKVSRDYKFYLSFENALCKDYVSEKLLKILQLRRTVPVVRGGADYRSVCPPNSVVNSEQFPTPKALADYLKQLANDEAAYVQMLQWGWDYEVRQPILPVCTLCDWMHDRSRRRDPYWDVAKWWTEETCHSPRDL